MFVVVFIGMILQAEEKIADRRCEGQAGSKKSRAVGAHTLSETRAPGNRTTVLLIAACMRGGTFVCALVTAIHHRLYTKFSILPTVYCTTGSTDKHRSDDVRRKIKLTHKRIQRERKTQQQ